MWLYEKTRHYILFTLYRHPKASKRSSFVDVKGELSLPDPTLMKWREEEKSGNPEALRLGASLESAQDLYMDLQNTYKHEK